MALLEAGKTSSQNGGIKSEPKRIKEPRENKLNNAFLQAVDFERFNLLNCSSYFCSTPKVVRRCPRCKTHAYHLGNDMGIRNRISCVNCGHVWDGRITEDEQS